MSRSYSSPRRSSLKSSPIIAFLLVASFGILFAGCRGPEDAEDSFSFTQDDIARYRDLANDGGSSSASGSKASSAASLQPIAGSSGSLSTSNIQLDLSMVPTYAAMRKGASSAQGSAYQVTNSFLNVRSEPRTTAELLVRLEVGASVDVLEFLNGEWAKVRLSDGREGFAAHRYLSRVTTDERLALEKKEFDNMYYVSFGFVNMRKEPNQSSDKIGEIPGDTLLRPISIENTWARVQHGGNEGYVSMSYLTPFVPSFIVRQDTYQLPVLHYRLTNEQTKELLETMKAHVAALKREGYATQTLREFRDLLLTQQGKDVRLNPKTVVVAVSGVTRDNFRAVSDALNQSAITATVFLETQDVGLSGITEKNIMTLLANGFDIQSATHTGDDLRTLTNTQVELELKQSRKLLEDLIKKPVFAVLYPQGGTNDRVAQMAGEAGYLFALTEGGKNSFTRAELLRIPAMVVFASTSETDLLKFVGGEE